MIYQWDRDKHKAVFLHLPGHEKITNGAYVLRSGYAKHGLGYCDLAGLSMNAVWLHSHTSTHASIYLGVLLSHMQNFIWQVNCMPTLQQVSLVILLQIIHLQLCESKWALQLLVDIDCRHDT